MRIFLARAVVIAVFAHTSSEKAKSGLATDQLWVIAGRKLGEAVGG